ncbi:MAG: ABC transporter ATP-binding protein [Chloroflexota bacterium]|nr:ABC transporter ATP-binding protein [Chloroflexota bacterium]
MPNHAILAEELTYSYGDFIAVDHIDFDVAEGEILGFLGPNGAGKSTTWKMLTGQFKPKGGKATILGWDIARDAQKVKAEIGVCFEYTNLYEQMTAGENLKLFADLFGIKKYDPAPLLKRVGMEDWEKHRVEEFSKGMKQRIMVARSLVNRPKILFLDEPTSGLDPVSAEAIRRLVLEERDRGATVFLTTHDMWEADKLCDRVAFIDQGKIVALDTPHDLKQTYGKRALKAEISTGDGLRYIEIPLDTDETPEAMRTLFANKKVVTVHSEEATLEDIFIKLTGRSLE